jgi:DNA-directed RNA polymerase subunit RPC12/RpoP
VTGKREDRKAGLMKEIEELVDKMLEEKPAPEEIDLGDIEQAAIKTGEKVKQIISQHLLDEWEEGTEAIQCPSCGKRLWMKDYRSRQVVTEAGEVKLTRAYYYCQECKQGIFPPG